MCQNTCRCENEIQVAAIKDNKDTILIAMAFTNPINMQS